MPVEHHLYNTMKSAFKNFLVDDEIELKTGELQPRAATVGSQ
jgi:hypothetical protein